MNFGIIGYGNIARKFVKSITYTSGGKVHAIASHSLDENDSYLQSHPLVKLYRDYEELLKDEDIEAVYIAVPHYEHKKWIIEAIKHHKAVLCEKPLVLKSEDIDEINQYVKEYQGYCLEAFKTSPQEIQKQVHYCVNDIAEAIALLEVEKWILEL